MNVSLRKITASVSITYSNGNFSNNLTGTEFKLEASEKDICLNINLWGNLSVRNKSANCYSDACELAEDHALLESVQIEDSQVIDGLLNAKKNSPSACWKIKLLLGEQGTFDYPVKPKMLNGSLFLNVS